MTRRVPADKIETLVGARRHKTEHIIRGDAATGMAYILHSEECRGRYEDLRDCPWSLALDRGEVWLPTADEPRFVRVRNGLLMDGGPVTASISAEPTP